MVRRIIPLHLPGCSLFCLVSICLLVEKPFLWKNKRSIPDISAADIRPESFSLCRRNRRRFDAPPTKIHLSRRLSPGTHPSRRSGARMGGVFTSEKMADIFSYESSEIDWCEDNYKHSEHIVESFNTMSSFVFFIIAPVMLYLLHPYAKERNLAVHLVWIMMIFVGLFSAYFHMTLSFVGQMLDELSILWVLALAYALWFPRRLFPPFIEDRSTFSTLVLVVTVITTVLSFIKPTANAYALNCLGLHLLYVLIVETRRCPDKKALQLAKISVVLWVLAISCWISDRLGCSIWQKLNFCYLHGFWHILIAVAVAYGTTLVAYLDAHYEIPYSLPGLQYWPCNEWAVGLPHIVLKGTTKTRKQC